jgi:membrane protease YdiL (CAAX protease family)
MQTACLAVILVVIFSFFSRRLQEGLRRTLERRPALVWLAPVILTLWFAVCAAVSDGTSGHVLTAFVLVYTAAPVLCAWVQKPGIVKQPSALDFLAILLLWLPLEFPAPAARLVAKHSQGFLHSIAYGIAILLALALFTGYRSIPEMKYNLPRRRQDLWIALAGFALTAPVLIAVGIWIGFIPMPHWPSASAGRMTGAFGVILIATGLPEEILFRSLIQNMLMQRLGTGSHVLFVASLIFGAAHLDNGPLPLPNWRYMILATIAGYGYGKVFQKSSTVLASTTFHAMVDWTKHFFF